MKRKNDTRESGFGSAVIYFDQALGWKKNLLLSDVIVNV